MLAQVLGLGLETADLLVQVSADAEPARPPGSEAVRRHDRVSGRERQLTAREQGLANCSGATYLTTAQRRAEAGGDLMAPP